MFGENTLEGAAAAVPSRGFGQTRIVWLTLIFLVAMHLLAAFAVVHLVQHFSWWTLGLGVVWYLFCGLSITAGYHRLFSHRSYSASGPARTLLLLFGAAAWQRSALGWAIDHRVHHSDSDGPSDPYSVKHGFWWAHVGWVFSDASARRERDGVPRDLTDDVLLRLQHRYWLPLAVVTGFVVPWCLGLLWGDPWGALLIAGCLRAVMMWHATYSVNSFAHRFGRQTYSKTESARDNRWVALASLGEGYHNFHHRFQTDYRNGVRWFHYDPTKWFIWGLSIVGLARGLVRVPRHVIAAARDRCRKVSTSPQ